MNNSVETNLSYQKSIKKVARGHSRKVAAHACESFTEAYNDGLELRCGDAVPTDEDCEIVLKEMGDPHLFSAGFLHERHWTLHPGFAQAFKKYEYVFGYASLFLAMALLGSTFMLQAYPFDSVLFGVLLTVICVWGALCCFSAMLLHSPIFSNVDMLAHSFYAKDFVRANNGVTLKSKGFFYTLIKGIVILAPLAVPFMTAFPQMYLFAALSVLFLAAVFAERTVRLIHQRTKTTYRTRMIVDISLVIAVSAVWLAEDVVTSFGYLASLILWKSNAVLGFAVASLAFFYMYMLCDILVALRRLHQCHRHSIRKIHPAIEKYLKTCSPYAPADVINAVTERIQDQLIERGADPCIPEDEVLIEVFEEIGSPEEVFTGYVSRGLVSRDFATRTIVYWSPAAHMVALVIATVLTVLYGNGGNGSVSELLQIWLMSWFACMTIMQYGSIKFYKAISECLRHWKN